MMKKTFLSGLFVAGLIFLVTLNLEAQNPTYLLELRNDIQVSSTIYEFDIYLLRTGSTQFQYASGQYGIVINPMIKNGGSISATMVASSPDPIIAATNQVPSSVSFYDPTNVIRISAGTIPGAGNGAIISSISPGTRICRIRLSNTTPFGQYQPNLTWTTTTIYPTQVYAYVGSTNTPITNHANHTTTNLVNPVLSIATSSELYNNEDFELQVYPNPFSDRITINYNLNRKTNVRLSVFDINGRLVEQLVNEVQQADTYSLSWVSGSRPEGVYIVKLQKDDVQKISRVTLIH